MRAETWLRTKLKWWTTRQNMLILPFMRKETVPINCEVCGIRVLQPRANQKTCSRACTAKRENSAWRERNPRRIAEGVAPSTVGAISELLVCVDLMREGYSVFRCVSPAAKYDLLIMHNGTGKVVSVEVKTGYKNKAGELSCPKPYWDTFDVLAIVVYEEPPRIEYRPPLETVFGKAN